MPQKRATHNSKQSQSPPLGADADAQNQCQAAPPPPTGATSSTVESEEATDSSWTDVVTTTGSASAKSTRTHTTDIITTHNNFSPPTTSTPIRCGPVNFSEHPDLADTSDPIRCFWIMVARKLQSLLRLLLVLPPTQPHQMKGVLPRLLRYFPSLQRGCPTFGPVLGGNNLPLPCFSLVLWTILLP